MKTVLCLLVSIGFLPTLLPAREPQGPTPKEQPLPKSQSSSVVRVNSTNQDYDFFRPWSKDAPAIRRGLGAVIAGNKVLVTAELVSNNTYIQLEKPDGGERTSATVQTIDYEANLAIVVPTNPGFLKGFQPLSIDTDIGVGDRLAVIQLESSGTQVSTQGLVTSIEVARYELEDTAFLLFRMSCPLQYRDNSYTVPVIKDHSLAGVLMRYDSRSQTVDIVPSPVIAHFLKDANSGNYDGFPRLGITFSPTRDPQLRRYAKIDNLEGGVYVSEVDPNSPAANSGLQRGDILLAIKGQPIDPDGNYQDPKYGKLSLINLTTTEALSGETINLDIVRNGEKKSLPVKLFHVAPRDYVIDPYVIGRPPRYYILGGLVFQELSRQYLKEWGTNWKKEAPQRLVYDDEFQSGLFPAHRKLVFLSQVLPSKDTLGYEQLNYEIVTRLNGKEIHSLEDFAQAVKSPVNGFHKIEFNEDPHVIYLDASQVERDAPDLQKLYSLPNLKRL